MIQRLEIIAWRLASDPLAVLESIEACLPGLSSYVCADNDSVHAGLTTVSQPNDSGEHRARQLLRSVAVRENGALARMILTDEPLTNDGGIQINGLASCTRRVAIVSTAWLSFPRFRHTAIHETGHLLGLHHCANAHCFMASGYNREKTYTWDWCSDCSAKLNELFQTNCFPLTHLVQANARKIHLR